MKKKINLTTECLVCGYETNEDNIYCPLCKGKTKKKENQPRKYVQQLPKQIPSNKSEGLVYYCLKCDEVKTTNICLIHNTRNKLALIFNDRLVLVEAITHLSDAFREDEIKDLLNSLQQEEKDLVYLNSKDSYRYFYKQDKARAGVMFVMSLLMSYLAFTLADYYQESKTVIISYFALGFCLATLFIFSALGWEYLYGASSVEYYKKPFKITLIGTGGAILYSLFMVFIDPGFILAVRYALISLGIIVIIYIIYSLLKVRHEKNMDH